MRKGPDVKQLEQILSTAGYNPGPIDELYTEQTRFALAEWQADHSYPGASSRTAKTVTVSLQPNGNGYKIGAENTAAVTIGPDLGTPSGPVGRSRPRQTGGGLPRLRSEPSARRRKRARPPNSSSRSTATPRSPSTSPCNLTGTASESDVVAPTGKITIPAGARQLSLSIPTIADGVAENDEDLTVNLVDGDTYDLGDTPAATTVITSPNDLPEITMTAGGTVVEGGKFTLWP